MCSRQKRRCTSHKKPTDMKIGPAAHSSSRVLQPDNCRRRRASSQESRCPPPDVVFSAERRAAPSRARHGEATTRPLHPAPFTRRTVIPPRSNAALWRACAAPLRRAARASRDMSRSAPPPPPPRPRPTLVQLDDKAWITRWRLGGAHPNPRPLQRHGRALRRRLFRQRRRRHRRR